MSNIRKEIVSMKRKNRPRSSSLFLMELILAIFFFTAASAVCVQIFVKAHVLSTESRALNHAVNLCTGAAEAWSVSPKEELEDGAVYTYYDEEFSVCKKEDARYEMCVETESAADMVWAEITMKVCDTKEEIYDLCTGRHLPRRTGYEGR